MFEIDLHNTTHKEGIQKVDNIVSRHLHKPGFSVNIITGNSLTLQNKIVQEIVDKYNLSYYILSNNLGQMVIKT